MSCLCLGQKKSKRNSTIAQSLFSTKKNRYVDAVESWDDGLVEKSQEPALGEAPGFSSHSKDLLDKSIPKYENPDDVEDASISDGDEEWRKSKMEGKDYMKLSPPKKT